MAAKRKKTPRKKLKTAAAIGNGWITTDEEEVERRRLRALEEARTVRAVKPETGKPDLYGDYRVSAEGGWYHVEFRHKDRRINSCNCPDHQVNGLGTCKHVERVARFLARKPAPPHRGCTEIFVNRGNGNGVEVLWADRLKANSQVKKRLSPFFDAQHRLLSESLDAFKALQRTVYQAGLSSAQLKISAYVEPWLAYKSGQQSAQRDRQAYLEDVAGNKRQLDFLKHPLYDYQHEGMLHLAFNGRAILADEMGLGKTVQAVAACELLNRLKGVERVLVISPVSLKTEWEEQIGKFTDRDSRIVWGNRADRLKQYQKPAFFYLANYEQVLYDVEDIQTLLMPDVIILDEAQRIKNWQTKTAQAVKKLRSPYVFVLTGTPLENRIDEIYSIAQVVDPQLLGPLFRFNRDFYQLDDKGRPTGYKNLDVLHRRLRPVLLRRRKADVEDELPERVVNTYFVDMHPEQFSRYEEYQLKLARLVRKAKTRPLTPDEHKLIQMWLSCMRMLCDTPYILDQSCRVSPKLDELKNILPELLEQAGNKIIIFSEWVKMLDLIRDYLDKQHVGYAWHTGQVAQTKRRAEINRFKHDAACRVFLSSDAGATGLNLQVANIVINVDLPWNPAKLEQRIARAWRKHQTRRVSVINLVCEHSIEHRIMSILEHKSSLAQGVLDGGGEPDMDLPTGRKVMIERLEQVMGVHPGVVEEPRGKPPAGSGGSINPGEDFYQEVAARHPQALDSMRVYENDAGRQTVFAVVHGKRRDHVTSLEDIARARPVPVEGLEVVDADTMALIQRLADAGVLSLHPPKQHLLASRGAKDHEKARRKTWVSAARERLREAERKFQMATLLLDGGFVPESAPAAIGALELAVSCLYQAVSGQAQDVVDLALVKNRLASRCELPDDIVARLARLRDGEGLDVRQDTTAIGRFLAQADDILLNLASA